LNSKGFGSALIWVLVCCVVLLTGYRVTNGFSKKPDNLKAHIALRFAHYNFVRVHQPFGLLPLWPQI